MVYKIIYICLVIICSVILISNSTNEVNKYSGSSGKERQNSNCPSWLANNFLNSSMRNKYSIFTGRILKVFAARHSKAQNKQDKFLLPQKMKNVNYKLSLVKVMHIFQGNLSVIAPTNHVLVLGISQTGCYEKEKKRALLINDRSSILLFAKFISYNVFKAELTLVERGDRKRKIKDTRRKSKSKRQELIPLRKGISIVLVFLNYE